MEPSKNLKLSKYRIHQERKLEIFPTILDGQDCFRIKLLRGTINNFNLRVIALDGAETSWEITGTDSNTIQLSPYAASTGIYVLMGYVNETEIIKRLVID